MRDPDITFDREVEAAIEDTYQFLEPLVKSESWKGDPDWHVRGTRALIKISIKDKLHPAVEALVTSALLAQAKKQKNKPTRNHRDTWIQMAAGRLIARGYERSRNDSMRHTESASSIIHKALKRLGVKMKEKRITDIVLQFDPETLILIASKADFFRVS
jgi:hypothetical protein